MMVYPGLDILLFDEDVLNLVAKHVGFGVDWSELCMAEKGLNLDSGYFTQRRRDFSARTRSTTFMTRAQHHLTTA
jgi:hypothetical protein